MTPVGGSLIGLVGQCRPVSFPAVLPSAVAGCGHWRRSRITAFADSLLTRGLWGPLLDPFVLLRPARQRTAGRTNVPMTALLANSVASGGGVVGKRGPRVISRDGA